MASRALLQHCRFRLACRRLTASGTLLGNWDQRRPFSQEPSSEAFSIPPRPTPKPIVSSLKDSEAAKFAAIAETWWDTEGPFKPLHALNPTRMSFIRSVLCQHFRKDPSSPRPLEGLKIVDVGCGGGIVSESLARMGAIVTGIDAVEKNICIASFHSELDPATASIEYRCSTAEQLVENQRKFDAVVALEGTRKLANLSFSFMTRVVERDFYDILHFKQAFVLDSIYSIYIRKVIEHVADPAGFCKSLANLAVTNGAAVVSTINRSMRAYATAIVAAEYILHWLPKGTHQWTTFLTPEELVLLFERASLSAKEMAGFVYSPITDQWALSEDVSVNFIAFCTKNGDQGCGEPS